ncbi:MAG: ABATE domain-containing protein [Candidatus Aminicenantes bacterium]|nr:ABATE domain-containing protein [Candidatus Aminicenantes bacterium]MDH5742913.1 ABATE domain-containing protein [Candidatus Aminicenantes bacterium]
MTKEKTYVEDIDLIGGKLCLDFSNTADWHARENPQENLNTYNDLVRWSLRAGILSEGDVQKLIRRAKRKPSESEKVLRRAIELREAIYRIFSSVAAGSLPKKEDLSVLSRNLSKTMAQSRIIPVKNGFLWDTKGDKDALDWILNPIVRSAADLLASDELNRVKQCADDRGCGLLFLDSSRNRSRRWCDMKDCGNRAKARRFYKRIRKK